MKREEVIKHCKYYKGEKECPYTETEGVLWGCEKSYVDMCSEGATDLLYMYVSEYMSVGLGTYRSTDNIPVSLKALLYNRYSNWNMADQEEFKTWYNKYYSK